MIADLSVNYAERFVLLGGHTAERFENDYGYDLGIYTYDKQGEVENGAIYVQLKATDHPRIRSEDDSVAVSIEVRDLLFWCGEVMPVLLVVYDVGGDTAYYLHIQQHFRYDLLPVEQATVTVLVSRSNRVGEDAIQQWRQMKAEAMLQARGENNDTNP